MASSLFVLLFDQCFFIMDIQEFYSGTCNNVSCGHTHITKQFVWEEKVGYSVSVSEEDKDNEYRQFVYTNRNIGLCSPCFALAMQRFVSTWKRLPYLRRDGNMFVTYVKELRECVSEDVLLALLVNNEPFQRFDSVVFHDASAPYHTVYRTAYYNGRIYHERLMQAGLLKQLGGNDEEWELGL